MMEPKLTSADPSNRCEVGEQHNNALSPVSTSIPLMRTAARRGSMNSAAVLGLKNYIPAAATKQDRGERNELMLRLLCGGGAYRVGHLLADLGLVN